VVYDFSRLHTRSRSLPSQLSLSALSLSFISWFALAAATDPPLRGFIISPFRIETFITPPANGVGVGGVLYVTRHLSGMCVCTYVCTNES